MGASSHDQSVDLSSHPSKQAVLPLFFFADTAPLLVARSRWPINGPLCHVHKSAVAVGLLSRSLSTEHSAWPDYENMNDVDGRRDVLPPSSPSSIASAAVAMHFTLHCRSLILSSTTHWESFSRAVIANLSKPPFRHLLLAPLSARLLGGLSTLTRARPTLARRPIAFLGMHRRNQRIVKSRSSIGKQPPRNERDNSWSACRHSHSRATLDTP